MTASPTVSSVPGRLWNRSFMIWLAGSAQSQLGSALASLALSFLVLHQTGRAGAMAVTLAWALLPNLLGPVAGAWVDRMPLKAPLIGADLLRGALQLTLGGLALAWGDVPLAVINAVAFLTGLAGVFASPASAAALPRLVPAADLTRANGVIGSVSQTAWLIGTLGGGFLVAWLSPAAAIIADGVSFLIMAALLTLVRLPGRSQRAAPGEPGVLADVRAGLALMRRSRLLSVVPVIALLLNMVMVQANVIMPKLMEALGPGAKGFGLYAALGSVGLLLSGLGIAALGQRLPLRRTVAAGFVLLTVTYAVMWRYPQYPVLLACGVLGGLAGGMINTPLFTLVQRLVPQAFLGRVFSVVVTASTLGMPVSLFAVAPLLDRLPMPVWFGLGALALALSAVAWGLVMLAERELPDLGATLPDTGAGAVSG